MLEDTTFKRVQPMLSSNMVLPEDQYSGYSSALAPEVMLTPDNSFVAAHDELAILSRWKRNYVAPTLSALSVLPEFHANGIRLDWLLRLVLARSRGHREPNFKEIERALNGGLARAGILNKEDPIEDLLCDSLATAAGDFRILPGQWESATAFTQVMVEAFDTLPSARRKDDTLQAGHLQKPVHSQRIDDSLSRYRRGGG